MGREEEEKLVVQAGSSIPKTYRDNGLSPHSFSYILIYCVAHTIDGFGPKNVEI